MAIITLPAGSTSNNLQSAINTALPQDVIELTSNMEFVGTVTIPAGLSITIQSAPGNIWTMTQTASTRHFNVLGSLTLDDIVVDGNTFGVSTNTTSGLQVSGSLTLLSGASIENCSARYGGAVYIYGGELNVLGGSVINNYATYGGGICAAEISLVTMDSGFINSNTADYGGGAYIMDNSTFRFNDGNVSVNTAQTQGGGVFLASGGTLYMTDGTVSGNRVTFDSGSGAGVCVIGGGYLEMSGGSITQNSLNLTGNQGGIGAGVCASGGEVLMTGGTISYNQSLQYGAGVGVTANGTFTMSGGSITYNMAESSNGGSKLSGGGIGIINGNANMQGGVIANNAAVYGGGVYLGYGTTNCRFNMIGGTIENNYARGYGGGIHTQNTASSISIGEIPVQEILPLIQNNRAGFYGGGISVYNSRAEIFSGIINGNSAINGGGIYVTASGACQVYYAAITDNEAASSGGGIYTENYDYSNPANLSAYQNIITSIDTVFANNRTAQAYVPPENAEDFYNLNYLTTSITIGSAYIHPLNNFDINYEGEQELLLLYRVIYDANGGTGGFVSDNLPPGTVYPLLSPEEAGISRPGYTFTGWNTEADDSGLSYQPGDTIVVADNIILYAQWILIEGPYDVIYDANGGTGGYTDTGIPNGTSYTLLSPEEAGISLPGYTFTGWNTEADDSGLSYQPGDTIVVTDNVILYAQWILIEGPYDVIYDANGGTGGYTDTGIPNGTSYTLLSPEEAGISRSGYTFTGWNTEADGSGLSYQPGDTIVVTDNVIFYAQWTLIEGPYDVIYDANGGTGGYTDTGIPNGTSYTLLSPEEAGISRFGYTFTGWNTEADGSGLSYQPGDTIIVTDNVILYAQWTLIEGPYDVIYDANGGTGSFADTDIPNGTSYTLLSPEEAGISRFGYTFTGWNTEADGSGISYQPGGTIVVTDNIILYAQWILIEGPYDVIYDANGGTGGYTDTGIPNGTSYTLLSPEEAGISRPGHTFTGWNTEADGNGLSYQPGDSIIINGNLVLYAQWEAVIEGTYQICYCSNCPCCCDKYGPCCTMIVPTNTAYTVISAENLGFCCSCHIFTGWNTNPDGRGTAYLPGDSIIITADITLYAQWISCKCIC